MIPHHARNYQASTHEHGRLLANTRARTCDEKKQQRGTSQAQRELDKHAEENTSHPMNRRV